MTAKHTPGEWKERIDSPIFNENPVPMPEYVIYGEGGKRLIASVWTKTKLGDKEAKANARLIAAAPELLGACKPFTQITGIDRHGRIIKEYPNEGTLDFRLSVEEFKAIQAAIRKAKGG